MKPTQVANTKAYRVRQRQKLVNLSLRVETLESQVQDLRAENEMLKEAKDDLLERNDEMDVVIKTLRSGLADTQARLRRSEVAVEKLEAMIGERADLPYREAHQLGGALAEMHERMKRMENEMREIRLSKEEKKFALTKFHTDRGHVDPLDAAVAKKLTRH